ncbi:MAG: BON domain-containing protein [Rudaea sp.]|nr:BON domain-containing protein [Rudaea sp.]
MTLALLIAGSLAACSAYQKCGLKGCPGDAEITAQVQALFKQHSELEIPRGLGVQTLDHVVYLTGIVDTGLERSIAESVAMTAPGVTRVVNSISVRNPVR